MSHSAKGEWVATAVAESDRHLARQGVSARTAIQPSAGGLDRFLRANAVRVPGPALACLAAANRGKGPADNGP
ncbi:hypothetical protein [Streptomyces kebangsaanensis]|uniref:hypothetical protein n=1 Tax=Streptomyces kebangsaanensis TaxID=864058 RepID=UPI001F3A9BFB|nr:hypothetical protein [Streptomyces kebangsaanensis]